MLPILYPLDPDPSIKLGVSVHMEILGIRIRMKTYANPKHWNC